MSLPFDRPLPVMLPDQLEGWLASALAQPVRLTITDNRRTMISARSDRAHGVLVRLHRMFLGAGEDVLRALTSYLRGRPSRKQAGRIDAFIAANAHQIRRGHGAARLLRPRGRVYDLRAIVDELNVTWFAGAAAVDVTFGRWSRGGRRRRRSIRLGTYLPEERLIRIHPVLDQAWIPPHVIRFIVFHELLHHMVPAPQSNGRHAFHCARFRAQERAHPDYERAVAWERANLDKLLRQAAGPAS
jgi:hypothetical protein